MVRNFELGGSYTPDEINEQADVESVIYDKEIDAYLTRSRNEYFFFDYWDTDERGKVYKYRGGREKYDETFE